MFDSKCDEKSFFNKVKKINSLIYLFYYLLLWVALPSTGLGERVFVDEFNERVHHTITSVEHNISDFQQAINPDWNRVNRQESQQDWLSRTGHWPVLFSSVFKPQFRISDAETLNPIFRRAPILGALTTTKIIFPFHYFW